MEKSNIVIRKNQKKERRKGTKRTEGLPEELSHLKKLHKEEQKGARKKQAKRRGF